MGETPGAAAALALRLAGTGGAVAGDWPARIFLCIDTAGDGQISFGQMEANGDGLLGLDEMTRAAPARMDEAWRNGLKAPTRTAMVWPSAPNSRMATCRFRGLDADGDGSVTRDEIASGFRKCGG